VSEVGKVQICVQCKAKSPEAETHSLISSRYGWRLIRRVDSTGNPLMEWRCPTCAERYKKLRALAGQSSGFYSAVPSKKEDEKKKGEK